MNPFTTSEQPLGPGWVLLKLFLLLLGCVASVFLAGWLLPLPKGQGLAYVAHPFLALAGGVIASLVYLITGLRKSPGENRMFWGVLAFSLIWSLLVFGRVL